jgi:hypothetical protein
VKPIYHELKSITFGDTWDGLTNCAFTSNGSAFSSPLTGVRMYFRDGDEVIGLELDQTSGITITSAASWQYQVNPISRFPLAVGLWYWSLEFTDTAGRRKTYWTGHIEVTKDATT